MGPMPWTINAELYPLSVRGLSTGISTMTNWASNLLISQFFLSVIDAFVGLFPKDTPAAAGDKGACACVRAARACVRACVRAFWRVPVLLATSHSRTYVRT
jgi:hypothetical protein